MNFNRNREPDSPEINLIPLIDVLLVIIIFLMMSATFSKIVGLEINLPSAAETEANAPEANEIAVAVTVSGEIIVNGELLGSTDILSIAKALGRATPAQGKEPVVVINADAKAPHQSVIDVMQAAQRASLPQVTFAVQATDP